MQTIAPLRIIATAALAAALAIACDSDEEVRPSLTTRTTSDLGLALDGGGPDLGPAPDDLPADADGPQISLLTPGPDQIVVGDLLRVIAVITDGDGVDPLSASVTIQGEQPVQMSASEAPDTYEAVLDVSGISGTWRLWVIAADLAGRRNSVVREFRRDAGPQISFLSPTADGRYRSSVSVRALVSDPAGVTGFEIRLGGQPLTLSQTSAAGGQLYATVIDFDDPYDPPLFGPQLLVASANNSNGAKTVRSRTFFADDQGPALTITSPAAGEVIGGTVHVELTAEDPAGVLASSVSCVVGNDLTRRAVAMFASDDPPTRFAGNFDTRSLTSDVLWPVVSCRAVDALGNESHRELQVGLDNAPPLVELDPQTVVHLARRKDGVLQCAAPFDPLGDDAANDLDRVPQVVALRALAEDQGNPVPAPFVPIARIDPAAVTLYVLDNTDVPLVVDSTGDGSCDAINPGVVPLASAPRQGEAVADQLAPIAPAGDGDFRPWAIDEQTFPFGVCENGDDRDPPDPLCLVSSLTAAIFHSALPDEPSLWTIPPVVDTSQVQCLGLPYDFGANQIDNGWACVAVELTDRAGNRSVSPPLRLWVDKSITPEQRAPVDANRAAQAPSCTGTLDANGQAKAGQPCAFPRRYPAALLRILEE